MTYRNIIGERTPIMTTTTTQIGECFDCQKTHTFPDISTAWRWAEAHQSKTGHSVSVPFGNAPRVSR